MNYCNNQTKRIARKAAILSRPALNVSISTKRAVDYLAKNEYLKGNVFPDHPCAQDHTVQMDMQNNIASQIEEIVIFWRIHGI
jgi:hypothetical protein